MKISKKLTLSHLSMAVLPLLILGEFLWVMISEKFDVVAEMAHKDGVVVIAEMSSKALRDEAVRKLVAIREARKQTVENYISTISKQLKGNRSVPHPSNLPSLIQN